MSQIESIQTNWYVLTGGPSSGKTKTLEYLAFLGYPIVPETARVWIDSEMSQGKTIEQIRADEMSFQRRVWRMKTQAERRINPNRLTFFDRGLPDTVAYYQAYNQPLSVSDVALKKHRYAGIFLLEPFQFQQDYARTEDADFVDRLNNLLHQAYTDLGHTVITVPKMPINRRAKFILDRISIG